MTHALIIFLALSGQDVLVEWPTESPDVPNVYLDIAPPTDEREVSETQVRVIHDLIELGYRVRSANVLTPTTAGEWLPLPAHLPPVKPVPRRPSALKSAANGSAVIRGLNSPGQVAGSLAGKTVYVSQGHGWYWSTVLNRWATQRGNTHGIVEDFVNAEAINHYLVSYLMNAGATVVTVRESDMNPDMVIVDESEAELTGEWAEDAAGWDPSATTFKTGQNPFAGGKTLAIATTAESTATAVFRPTLPKDGTYSVNVSWAAASDRAPDVQITVHHAGGDAVFLADQRRDGNTWHYLGRFRFRANDAWVKVTNSSQIEGATVNIDAVRFGGGMGLIERGTGDYPAAGPLSGQPRWEECCRYHAQFQGAPESVYDASGKDSSDDVGCRSRYAHWRHQEGEDAVFYSWHSNAPDGGTGTSTWVYGPNSPGTGYDFTGIAGSDTLAKMIHEEMVADIRAEWDPDWKDRGLLSAWFGELNPKSNPSMPAALSEVAFHATESDAALLAEPRFRRTLARSVYHGIVRYFAQRDGLEPRYAPETPHRFRVIGNADGTVTATWDPPAGGHGPTHYRVWLSTDGFGYSPVASTTDTSTTLTNLAENAPIFLYVTSANDGGESFPTATLAATPGCYDRSQRVLIVQGFTRLDRQGLPVEDLSPWGLGMPMRFDQDKVNTFDYAVVHGQALAANGAVFDSAEASALESGALPLTGYGALDWILGEESTIDETFSGPEQAVLAAYLDQGGRLLVSGSEIAWDLDAKGSSSDRAFCANYLKVLLGSDDAETYMLSSGVGFTRAYDVQFADVLEAQDGANVLWSYSGGATAAVSWNGDFSVVTAGFPLETVDTGENRAELFGEALNALGYLSPQGVCGQPPETTDRGADAGFVDTTPQPKGTRVVISGQTHTSDAGGCSLSRSAGGNSVLLLLLALLGLFLGKSRFSRYTKRTPSNSI
jgi:N-acetylmuramoyl-L-alanine amidase